MSGNKMALDALTAAQRAINSMKVEAETAGAGGDQEMFDKEMAEHEAFRAAHPAPVAAQPSQAPVVQAMQAGSYSLYQQAADAIDLLLDESIEHRLVKHAANPEIVYGAKQTVLQLRASSGATTAQAVRMLTREELNDVALSEQVGWGPGEYVEAVQLALLRVNAGRTIPADGKIGSAA